MITSEEPTVSSTGRYTVTQTCEILGIHRNTLREYTSSGRIKCGFRRDNLNTPGLRKALGLQSIDFQIMCENLAVWDGVEIFDPEQAMQTGHVIFYCRSIRRKFQHA